MAKNKSLNAAAKAKEDEFYTQLTDVEKELRHYRNHFKGKTVFCNCDDPFESNFFKYFVLNFNRLGLKKLIATCYTGSPIAGSQLSLFDVVPNAQENRPYKAVVTTVYDATGDGGVDMDDIAELFKQGENELSELAGNGDFRSEECLALMDEADIVTTNPPFSLFNEYILTLIEHGKEFVVIGSQNSVTYKDIFPLLMTDQMWLGYNNGDMAFRVPDYYEPRETRFWIDENGQKWRSMGNIAWYTNLDIKKRHEELILVRRYDPSVYPTYANLTGCINVDKVADIPCDYDGLMGVPITFLDKYNPDQFEILGLDYDSSIPGKTGLDERFVKDYYDQGNTGSITVGHPSLGYYKPDGKVVRTYRRVIIRNRHPEEPRRI